MRLQFAFGTPNVLLHNVRRVQRDSFKGVDCEQDYPAVGVDFALAISRVDRVEYYIRREFVSSLCHHAIERMTDWMVR